VVNAFLVSRIKLPKKRKTGRQSSTELTEALNSSPDTWHTQINFIYEAVTGGAQTFLFEEYKIMAVFIVVFGLLVFVLVGSSNICGDLHVESVVDPTSGAKTLNVYPQLQTGSCWIEAAFTTLSFVLGGVASIVAGYIGMKIAVFSNARTAIQCAGGLTPSGGQKYQTEELKWKAGFNCAFRAGSVMGFSLTGVGVLVLYVSTCLYSLYKKFSTNGLASDVDGTYGHSQALFECVAGFGLGGSSIALFGRVGGGIYTKAADVGADLVGKVEKDLPEDDIRNSACIADNVGDNVGDVAGMGADLFGSFAESSSAALVIAGSSFDLSQNWASLMFPVMISAVGILACLITHFAIYVPGISVTKEAAVERMLQLQLYVSTIVMTPLIFVLAYISLPTQGWCSNYAPSSDAATQSLTCWIGGKEFTDMNGCSWWGAGICVCLGLWGGLIIGIYTDFMTSLRHQPTKEVADSCKTGAATNIIYGLALGYKSVVLPVFVLVLAIYGSWRLADMYGISLAALGMLTTLATGLSIDAYGPVCDNAGGFAEMAGMDEEVREKTDALDAAGNTTAAVGKGFAIGSAALVSLALFGAFTVRAQISVADASILHPVTFSGLLVGSMLPYWFTAMTMKAVGVAAKEMIVCVRRQFNDPTIFLRQAGPPQFTPEFLNDDKKRMAFYKQPIAISTQASLFYMIGPGLLVMLSPIIAGFFFGKYSVVGLLAGGMVSGVQMAISQSNTGGAWDNAKKLTKKWKAQTLYKSVLQFPTGDANEPNRGMRFAMHVTESTTSGGKDPSIIDVMKTKLLSTIGLSSTKLIMNSAQLAAFKKSVAQNSAEMVQAGFTAQEVSDALAGQGPRQAEINQALEVEMQQVADTLFKEQYDAAVTGDTVGDPLKDTSGPSLNILMKLMAIISVVFAPFFVAHSLNKNDFL
jgi:inorganic pyrophosphatase